jgi:lysylphosphatidylglycerol synthetase-like protein (DUF2156 family)
MLFVTFRYGQPHKNFMSDQTALADNTTEQKPNDIKKEAILVTGSAVGVGAVGAGAVGAYVATALTIPVVNALGFTSGGILAGSVGATIMSWSGGAVASGSAVALLQSAGAVGAVSLGAAIGIATGVFVVVGGAVAGATIGSIALYRHIKKKHNSTEGSDIESMHEITDQKNAVNENTQEIIQGLTDEEQINLMVEDFSMENNVRQTLLHCAEVD